MARRSLSSLVALLVALPALAHPRDELGQASYLGVTHAAVTVELNLAPGEQLVPAFARLIAKNGYPEQVLSELSLTLDGKPLALQLVRGPVATPEQSTKLYFEAPLPNLALGKHTLRYENHHTPFKSGYIATTLAGTEGITIGKQLHDSLQQTLTVEWENRAAGFPLFRMIAVVFLVLCVLYTLVARSRRV